MRRLEIRKIGNESTTDATFIACVGRFGTDPSFVFVFEEYETGNIHDSTELYYIHIGSEMVLLPFGTVDETKSPYVKLGELVFGDNEFVRECLKRDGVEKSFDCDIDEASLPPSMLSLETGFLKEMIPERLAACVKSSCESLALMEKTTRRCPAAHLGI